MIPHLSTCKSPQGMMGAVIKSYWARRKGLDPADIFSVSIMPCTAKKFEAARPELSRGGIPDVDAVLTTRELANLLKAHDLNLQDLPADRPDSPFAERSTAGKLFGAAGGVMEAALRSAFFMISGRDAEDLDFTAVRGLDGIKECRIKIGGLDMGVAAVNTLKNARKMIEEVKKGRSDLHFIEVMSCPGGCVGGGGQPLAPHRQDVKARLDLLYEIDRSQRPWRRLSHRNEEVKRLYADFLGKPFGHRSHELLHTRYNARSVSR